VPPIRWVPGALSLGVKRLGREAQHSPPSSAEVKEFVELHLHSHNTSSWHGVLLRTAKLYLYLILVTSKLLSYEQGLGDYMGDKTDCLSGYFQGGSMLLSVTPSLRFPDGQNARFELRQQRGVTSDMSYVMLLSRATAHRENCNGWYSGM